MASLIGRAPKDSYPELLKLDNTGAGVDVNLRAVQDGTGNNTPLQLSTTQIALNGMAWPASTGNIGQFLTVSSSGQLGWSTGTGITYAGTWNPTLNEPALSSGVGSIGEMYKIAAASTIGIQQNYVVGSFFAPYTGNVVDVLTGLTADSFPTGMLIAGAGIAPGTTIVSAEARVVTASTTTYMHITMSQNVASSVTGGQTLYFGTPLDGLIQFNIGDMVIFDGLRWDKIDGIASEVTSVFGRTGDVVLLNTDISTALGYTPANASTFAPLASPALTGTPTAPTATIGTVSTQIATTAFVNSAVAASVVTFNSRSGNVSLTSSDVSGALGYSPVSPTTLSTYATLASPAMTGTPTAPTLAITDSSTKLATTAYVNAAILNNNQTYGVATFNGRSGTVTLSSGDITSALGFTPANATSVASTYAPISSPTLTGNPKAPTATTGDNSTSIATTAFVANTVAGLGSSYAPTTSPSFSGTPTAPTAAAATNNTQIATTAFVQNVVANSVVGVTSFNTRTGAVTLTSGDVTSALGFTPSNIASPAFTGSPTAPTQSFSDNSTKIATTGFVRSALSSYSVSSFNSRVGAVNLAASDVTGVGGALLASPAFTGTPTAPTPSNSDNSTTLATTAFVQAVTSALASGIAYLGTWNANTNTPTITSGQGTRGNMYAVSVAGNTVIDGNSSWNVGDFMIFDGTKWGRIASSSGQVVSFNARTGAITLQSSDISTALGYTPANIASPTFTGIPNAPTAGAGANNTQIATTQFVNTAITNANATLAPLASPALTGTPTAPTAATADNSTTIATTAYVNAAIVANAPPGSAALQSITSYFPGNISPFTGALRYYPRQTIGLQTITLYINTPPTSVIVVDLLKNGVSVFGSGTKPSIAVGANVSTPITLSTVVTTNDYLTMNILSGNGSDMTARIDYS